MITKLSKILFELLFLVIGICIAVLVVVFAFNKISSNSEHDTFSGTVNKKELVITSPSFATIEKLNVYEGQLVKKGDELANLKILIQPKNQSDAGTLIDSETYKAKGNNIMVYAPTDSIVGKVFYAEKSSVRPEIDIITLYPLQSSSIIINDKFKDFKPGDYNDLFLQKQSTDKDKYLIKLLDTFPVDSQKDGGKTFYAAFAKNEDSKLFDNGGDVIILAVKKNKPTNLILDLKDVIVATYSKVVLILHK